jgi:hypothetical protein
MRPVCAICGRRTTPAAYIGKEPVGPTCAKRAGFLGTKAIKGSRIRLVAYKPTREVVAQTVDMFAGVKP